MFLNLEFVHLLISTSWEQCVTVALYHARCKTVKPSTRNGGQRKALIKIAVQTCVCVCL